MRLYRDPRVRAVLAMAPGLAGAFLPDSLAQVEIPVAIVAEAANAVVPVKSKADFFAAKIPLAQLTISPAPSGHLVFTGLCLEAGRKALPRVCNDPPGSTAPPFWSRQQNCGGVFRATASMSRRLTSGAPTSLLSGPRWSATWGSSLPAQRNRAPVARRCCIKAGVGWRQLG